MALNTVLVTEMIDHIHQRKQNYQCSNNLLAKMQQIKQRNKEDRNPLR
jgi:hypothetical protein